MNRRIDLGNAVTAFVLIAMFGFAVVMSPKAKVPPLTRLGTLDSALVATFEMSTESNVNRQGHLLTIQVTHTPAQPSPDDSNYALAERVAGFANAHLRDTAIQAINVLLLQPNGYAGGGFLPVLLDGRVTPVKVDRAPVAPEELQGVISHLPLATGYAARLPMQWADRSPEIVWQSVYVEGVDSACRCWNVETAGVRGGLRRFHVPLKP